MEAATAPRGWVVSATHQSKHIMLANAVTATMATALFNQITCISKLRWAEKRRGGRKSGKVKSQPCLWRKSGTTTKDKFYSTTHFKVTGLYGSSAVSLKAMENWFSLALR